MVHMLIAHTYCKNITDFSKPFTTDDGIDFGLIANYLCGKDLSFDHKNIDEIEKSAKTLGIEHLLNIIPTIRLRFQRILHAFKFANLQEYINTINETNSQTIIQTIKSSKFFQKEKYHHDLCLFILISCEIRPKSNEQHLSLIEDLCKLSDHFHSELKKTVVSEITQRGGNFYVYRQLFLRNLLELDLIKKIYNTDIKNFFYMNATAHNMIKIWFGPELKLKFDDRNDDETAKEIYNKDINSYIKLINNGYNPNVYATAIRNDDIDELQSLCSATDFDFNMTIKPSPFERTTFLNFEEITLLQIATFYGSIKCFRFLILNGCSTDNCPMFSGCNSNNNNSEIIRLLYQENNNFEAALISSTLYHNNEIYEWFASITGNINIYKNIQYTKYLRYNYRYRLPDSSNLLEATVQSCNLTRFLQIYQYGIDIKTAMHIVSIMAKNGLIHFLELFATIKGNDLCYKAGRNRYSNENPLETAVKGNWEDCVLFLLSTKAYDNQYIKSLEAEATNEMKAVIEQYLKNNE
ncbi:cask-interacting protein (caskin) 1,2 [Histomonas meleagridis]|uniref:cask-interacting protein (caskin) n=1 Tax=Histomonas meleagridis TaxID=135588 RepID=UPI00355A133A|nr:cask-interacting protein (caskin) 1,2 [Histomonas meleagridis]KAH0806989.1 cask-interacting protein (caskin) [Histomonas meleagridis]